MHARLYHAHHSRHMEDLPFWLELARRQAGPILELGCGSGRLSLPLARLGAAVTGLDTDPEMLSLLAEQRLQLDPETGISLNIIDADMTAFDLGERFALILLPCNTYSTLSAGQRRDTLGCVLRHLLPGGLFAASSPNPYLLRALPRRSDAEVEESFPHPLDGEPVQVSSSWQRHKGLMTFYWHYDHLLSDGRVERTTLQTSHDLAPAGSYLAELEVAGLRLMDIFGDFDRASYTPESPSLIFTARIASE